jgi:hypothetical protein
MMDVNDMMGRCMDAMGSMMGSGVIGGSGILFVVLALVFLLWVMGLAALGALAFWAVRKLSAARD